MCWRAASRVAGQQLTVQTTIPYSIVGFGLLRFDHHAHRARVHSLHLRTQVYTAPGRRLRCFIHAVTLVQTSRVVTLENLGTIALRHWELTSFVVQ